MIHINTKFHPRWLKRPDKQPAPATPAHERFRRHDNPKYIQYSAPHIADSERELREWIRLRLSDASNEARISEIADFVMKRWVYNPEENERDSRPGFPCEEDDSIDSQDENNPTEPRVHFCGYEVGEGLVETVSKMVEKMQKEQEAALRFYGLDSQAPKVVICHCEELRGVSTSPTKTMPTDRYLMLVRSPPPWDSVYGPGAPLPKKIRPVTKPSLSNSPNLNLDRSSLRARKSTQEMFGMIAQRRGLPTPATPSSSAPAPPISTNPFRKVFWGGSTRGELNGLHHRHGDPAQGGNPDSVPDSRTPKRIRPISEFPVPPRPTPAQKPQSQRAKNSGGSGIVPKKSGQLKQTTLLGAFEKRT